MNTKETKYLILIILIFIAACIETDIYLPAFPDMMTFFSVSEEKIQSPLAMTVAMIIYTFGANWTQGLYFPEGMELHPNIKGVTASLLTSIRLLLSAGIVGVTSLFYNATIYPVAVAIIGVVLIILPLIVFYEKNRSQNLETKCSPEL